MLWGILELTNGCIHLGTLEDPELRFAVCAVLLSFGGLCVTMQTVSVTGKLGSGLYFPGKILQTCITAALVLPVVDGRFLPAVAVLGGISAIIGKNFSSIFRRKPV
jgi:hypothetical protein